MNSAAERTDPEDRRGASSRGLGRAFGGALLFALPMLMTMELWQLGFTMDRWRLLLLLALALPTLVGVSHRLGFEKTFGWREDLRDTCVALGVGIVAAATILALFGVIGPRMSADEIVGKIAVETVPAALGALLAQSQFGTDHPAEADERALSGYFGALFLMLVGALYFALNIAPTDEIMAIAYGMSAWHAIATVVVSVALIHGFVFALGFRGGATAAARRAAGKRLPAIHPARIRHRHGDQPLHALDLRPRRRRGVRADPHGHDRAGLSRRDRRRRRAADPLRPDVAKLDAGGVERIVGLVSAAAVASTLGFLTFQASQSAEALPELAIARRTAEAGSGSGAQLRFVVSNGGARPARDVTVALLVRGSSGKWRSAR